MSISFAGSNSVAARTIFTDKGPIAKRDSSYTSGYDLNIISPTDVELPSLYLNQSYVGKYIKIDGSSSGVNDGSFKVASVLTPRVCRLEGASFSVSNDSITESSLVLVCQELRTNVGLHIPLIKVHGTQDVSNVLSSSFPHDLSGCILALNEIKAKYNHHISIYSIGARNIHRGFVSQDFITSVNAHNLNSSVNLANEIQRKFQDHVLSIEVHYISDPDNRVHRGPVVVNLSTSEKRGPLSYTIFSSNNGVPANESSDVTVRVNSNEVVVEYVEGLSGAIVLQDTPSFGDDIKVDYGYIKRLPSRNFVLNNFGYLLNSAGNRSFSGTPEHVYAATTSLTNSTSFGDAGNFRSARTFGYKYKAFDRLYTAGLNDATGLILNSPLNTLNYGFDQARINSVSLSWNAQYLPTSMADPWTLRVGGTVFLNPDDFLLNLFDNNGSQGLINVGPFYSKAVDFNSNLVSNLAFRMLVKSYTLNGDSTQVGFGLSDGYKLCHIGFIEGLATNLTSALYIVNALVPAFNQHLSFNRVHAPVDTQNTLSMNPARDLATGLIVVKNLINAYNKHLSLGPIQVHQLVDDQNSFTFPLPVSLVTFISSANNLLIKFNAHLVQNSVHYVSNSEVHVNNPRQIGILTKRGHSTESLNYESGSVDWTVERTYRLYRDVDGNVSLYTSGSSSPIASVKHADLPLASSAEFPIDSGSQVFWGVLGSGSTSESSWRLLRVTTVGLSHLYKLRSINLSTDFSSLPEESSPAWINVGYGGDEFLYSGLILDSSSQAAKIDVNQFGYLNGAYKGYLRVEPFLSTKTTIDTSFTTQSVYHTHSVDNLAYSVIIRDNDSTVNLCFIQPNPIPATIIGTIVEPFNIVSNDGFHFILNENDSISSTIGVNVSTAVDLANAINLRSGLTYAVAFASGGALLLSSVNSGSSSSITILGGTMFQKVGIPNQKAVGSDSGTDPALSYFGHNYPELEPYPWKISGTNSSSLIDRRLKTVKSTGVYTTYYTNNWIALGTVISPSFDWKMNVSLEIEDVISGSVILAGPNRNYGGVYLSLNEGNGGKNLEIYYTVDNNGIYYWSFYSLDPYSGSVEFSSSVLTSLGQQALSIFTDKTNNVLTAYLNGAPVATFVYSALKPGFGLPTVAFGTGAKALENAPLTTASSTVYWNQFTVFRDSYMSPAASNSAASRRAVAIFNGGSPSLLKNYTLALVDWSNPHTYRVMKDPSSGVSVYIDGSSTPVLSVPVDQLETASIDVKDLGSVASGNPYVSFGHFDPYTINRSKWTFLGYSIGKLLQDGGVTYNRPALNTANVLSSMEHTLSADRHVHGGSQFSSVQTPVSDFQFSNRLKPIEVYNDGQVPFSRTWAFSYPSDVHETISPIASISSVDFSSKRGYIGSFISDTLHGFTLYSGYPALGPSDQLSELISLTNTLIDRYLAHITDGVVHFTADLNNNGVSSCSDFASLALSLEDLNSIMNNHFGEPGVHFNNDSQDLFYLTPITDLNAAVRAYNSCSYFFSVHATSATFHVTDDENNVPSSSSSYSGWADIVNLANNLKACLNSHYYNYSVHVIPDQNPILFDAYYSISNNFYDVDSITLYVNNLVGDFFQHTNNNRSGSHKAVDQYHPVAPSATDLDSAWTVLDNLRTAFNEHRTTSSSNTSGRSYHSSYDPGVVTPRIPEFYLAPLYALTESISASIGSHIGYNSSHKKVVPQGYRSYPLSFVESEVLVSLNNSKSEFNKHVASIEAHMVADSSDVITAVDAIDLDSASALANELLIKVNRHYTMPTVHDSVVLIKVENDPSKIISSLFYQEIPSGDENRLASFGDEWGV